MSALFSKFMTVPLVWHLILLSNAVQTDLSLSHKLRQHGNFYALESTKFVLRRANSFKFPTEDWNMRPALQYVDLSNFIRRETADDKYLWPCLFVINGKKNMPKQTKHTHTYFYTHKNYFYRCDTITISNHTHNMLGQK